MERRGLPPRRRSSESGEDRDEARPTARAGFLAHRDFARCITLLCRRAKGGDADFVSIENDTVATEKFVVEYS